MNFIYPADMLKPHRPDELFQEEANALRAEGHSISLLDSEAFALTLAAFPSTNSAASLVVYRGWMVNPKEYQLLMTSLEQAGAKPFTSLDQYLAAHYLPNWYPLLADLTPETVVLDPAADLVPVLTELGWPRFFVKDYVKSLKTAGGSVAERPEAIQRVVAEMRKYRGTIEGGLCVRRFEDFVLDSEQRFFVVNRKCYTHASEQAIPPIVQECASRLNSPFFSIDVAIRTDGTQRIVEVGDGQVSDLVGWTAEQFASLWD